MTNTTRYQNRSGNILIFAHKHYIYYIETVDGVWVLQKTFENKKIIISEMFILEQKLPIICNGGLNIHGKSSKIELVI